MEADSLKFESAKNRSRKFFLKESGSDLSGVRRAIRLSTRKVPSILEAESYLDLRTIGQMVSSWRVYVVRLSLSTNLFDTRLNDEPESIRQRACDVVVPTLTSTVGSKIVVFWRRISVKDVDLEMVDFRGCLLGAEADELRFLAEVDGSGDFVRDRERDLEREDRRSFASRGLTCNKVW